MKSITKDFDNDKLEFIKNPMVTEFLGIGPAKSYLESELEKSILNKLEAFLLELGKGFSFVERQKLIRTEEKVILMLKCDWEGRFVTCPPSNA